MALVDASIQINRPVEDVYAFISNPQNQKALGVGITEITLNGPVAVGTRYTLKGQAYGRSYSTENEICAMEPNKTFGIKTLAAPPASPVTNTYSLEPAEGGTKLTVTMDCVIFPGTEGMVKPQLVNALNTGNAALKKLLEG